MPEIIGGYIPETVAVHGSVLDPQRFHDGSDVDVVGTAPAMTGETKTAVLEFMRRRGIDPRHIEVDYKQSLGRDGSVLVPSPLGVEVPFEVLTGNSPVALERIGGLSAALRAAGLGYRRLASEELDRVYVNGVPVVTDVAPQYGELVYPRRFGDVELFDTSPEATVLVNDVVVGVKGLKRAFERSSGTFVDEFQRRMKNAGAIIGLAQGRVLVPRDYDTRRVACGYDGENTIRIANFEGFNTGVGVHDVGMYDGVIHTLTARNMTKHFQTVDEFEARYTK